MDKLLPEGMILMQGILIYCAGAPFQSPEFTVKYDAVGGLSTPSQGMVRALVLQRSPETFREAGAGRRA